MMQVLPSSTAYPKHPSVSTSFFQVLTITIETLSSSVELKQWSKVQKTRKDAIVKTFLGKSLREVTHPSYQAWTYAALIHDFNVEIQEGNISLHPCAYLHNCLDPSVVKSSFYEVHTR